MSCHRITLNYSLLLRSVTHSPTVSHSYGDDFISDFKQTNTNIHPPSGEKLWDGGCLSSSSPTRQWGWNAGARRLHLTPFCCPPRPLSSSSHLADSRAVLDSWMCTRLLGNKASWHSARQTEGERSVDSSQRMKTTSIASKTWTDTQWASTAAPRTSWITFSFHWKCWFYSIIWLKHAIWQKKPNRKSHFSVWFQFYNVSVFILYS